MDKYFVTFRFIGSSLSFTLGKGLPFEEALETARKFAELNCEDISIGETGLIFANHKDFPAAKLVIGVIKEEE